MVSDPDRRRALVMLALCGLLVTAVHLVGTAAPPVYDGLPVPADPYRYVDPPPGTHNPGPPLSAHVSIDLVGGGNSPIDLPTGEYPPQAEIELFHGDVNGLVAGVPAVTTAQVTITPVHAPTVPLPAGRQLHGNVYDLEVVANAHSLQLNSDPHTIVSLRQPRTSAANPRIAVLDGDHWQLLETHPSNGPGVLSARLPRLGDVAILEETSGFVPSHGRSDALAGIGTAAVVLLIVLGVRLSRSRRRRMTDFQE